MIGPIGALLLASAATSMPGDITPVSLTVVPEPLELGTESYDWQRQLRRGLEGTQLADGTANCNTGPTPTNIGGNPDSVPDCTFD